MDDIEYIFYIILIDHQERLLYLLIYLDIGFDFDKEYLNDLFHIFKRSSPHFLLDRAWERGKADQLQSGINYEMKTKNKKGIHGKSLHWTEHRISKGKRCIVETAL